jgi:hypothetical protein
VNRQRGILLAVAAGAVVLVLALDGRTPPVSPATGTARTPVAGYHVARPTPPDPATPTPRIPTDHGHPAAR